MTEPVTPLAMPSSEPCGHHGDHSHDVHAFNSHDIAARLQAAEQMCATKGARFTPLRRTVYQLILESEKPLGAYDLIQSYKTAEPKKKAAKRRW